MGACLTSWDMVMPTPMSVAMALQQLLSVLMYEVPDTSQVLKDRDTQHCAHPTLPVKH